MDGWMEKAESGQALRCCERQIDVYKSIGFFIAGKHYFSHDTTAASKGKHIYCLDRYLEALLGNTAELAKQSTEKVRKVFVTD